MNVTIVYDSVFGNTGTIAKVMAEALSPHHQVRLLPRRRGWWHRDR